MALTKIENHNVVAELRDLIKFCHGRRYAAQRLGISAARLSQVLNGAPAGMKVLQALSREAHKPIDEVIGRQAPELQDRVRELEDRVRELEKDNRELGDALEAMIDLGADSKTVLKRCRV